MPAEIKDLSIAPPKSGKSISLNSIIEKAPSGSTFRLEPGKYLLEEPISSLKSYHLIGADRHNTIIIGQPDSDAIHASGDHKVVLERIAFLSPIQIRASSLLANQCRFSDAALGIVIGGNTSTEVVECDFREHKQGAIVFIQDAHGRVSRSTFADCEIGVAATQQSKPVVELCTFTQNGCCVYSAESASLQVSDCEFRDNKIVANGKGDSAISLFINKIDCGQAVGVAIVERCRALLKGNKISGADEIPAVRGTNHANLDLRNNKFYNNIRCVEAAEDCSSTLDENEFIGGETAFTSGDRARSIIKGNDFADHETAVLCKMLSKVEIVNNEIARCQEGVCCRNMSTAQVTSNFLHQNTGHALSFRDDAQFHVEDNRIFSSTVGVVALERSKGKLVRNKFKPNGSTNFKSEGQTGIAFDDFRETKTTVALSHYADENRYLVRAPLAGQVVDLPHFVSSLPSDSEVILEPGTYTITQPLYTSQSLTIKSSGPEPVEIVGEDFAPLLTHAGPGTLSLSGIHLRLEAGITSNVVTVRAGNLNMAECAVEGGYTTQFNIEKNDGAGLLLLGTSSANIANSRFRKNKLGICVQDKAAVSMHGCTVAGNYEIGVAAHDRTEVKLDQIDFTKNGGGVKAFGDANLKISGSSFSNNVYGLHLKGKSNAVITECKAFENEMNAFQIDISSKAQLLRNTITKNGYAGIALYGNSQTLVESNQIESCGRWGIDMGESAQGSIRNNSISKSRYGGIIVGGSAQATIELNNISGSDAAIRITEGARASIDANKLAANQYFIADEGGAIKMGKNVFVGGAVDSDGR